MNPETPRPIDPEDIRIGDRVQRRFEHDGGDIGTHEGTVKDVGSTYIRLQTLAIPKRIENATWTLLDRPAPRNHIADEARHELAGKNLACWCHLDQPCHADVLLELANPGRTA